jgi:multidrug efflux system membrane fusion protein
MNRVAERRGGARRNVPARTLYVIVGAVAALAGCSDPREARVAAVPVTVAQAEQRSVPFEIAAPGTVEPVRAAAVTAQVSGMVIGVKFREGEEVREGDVLVEIDPRPYHNALAQAEAALARDVIQLETARRQVERYQSLAQNQGVAAEQFESLQATARGLEATVKADSASLDNARLNLEYTQIRAPISGRTGSLLIKQGNVVRAGGAQQVLVTVNQTRPILVRFAVPAPHLPLIRRYQDSSLVVRVQANNDTTSLSGTLVFVDNAVDTTTGTIMLKGRFDNAKGTLWPGQFVTATLVVYEQRDAVVVPISAVVEAEEGNYVYVVDKDRKAETRPIVVGRSIGDDVIVTDGLAVGETVVTDGQLRLVPGATVQIRNIQNEQRGGP